MSIFPFSDFSPDDGYDDEEQPYDDYLTVKGFLEIHFGDTGKQIYASLLRRATKAARDIGGLPGIVFNDDGGEFVSFSEEPDDGFDVIRADEDD